MENEIKVNEFIRTKDGVIDKVIIDYKGKCNNPNCNRKHISCEKNYYNEDEIVKHSPNLIDILECGDYINGHKIVNEIWGEDDNNLYFEIEGGYNKARYIGENEMKKVVTKEQFEAIGYKVTKM